MAEKKKVGWRKYLDPFSRAEAAKPPAKKKKKKKTQAIDWEKRLKDQGKIGGDKKKVSATKPKAAKSRTASKSKNPY
jgi:hypothetical protein